MFKNKKGFTLIELLVVIAIIGMLSSVVLVSLGPARAKSRDARRQSDIRQISLAMEMASDDNNGNYLAIGVTSGRITTTAIGSYLATIPQDPGGGSSTNCASDDMIELTAGGYCGWASSSGSQYCIYAKLSDGTWSVASSKGVRLLQSYPTSLANCN
jgi:prepilin-type N-terminal cleavage/methylation domain-containing protein